MNWPRGRYNRRRIVGVRVQLIIDITDWWLRCSCSPWCGAFLIFVGPFHLRIEWEYDFRSQT